MARIIQKKNFRFRKLGILSFEQIPVQAEMICAVFLICAKQRNKKICFGTM